MLCANCNNEIDDDSYICSHCGMIVKARSIRINYVNKAQFASNKLKNVGPVVSLQGKDLSLYGFLETLGNTEKIEEQIGYIKIWPLPENSSELYQLVLIIKDNLDVEKYIYSKEPKRSLYNEWLKKLDECYKFANAKCDIKELEAITNIYNKIHLSIDLLKKSKDFKTLGFISLGFFLLALVYSYNEDFRNVASILVSIVGLVLSIVFFVFSYKKQALFKKCMYDKD